MQKLTIDEGRTNWKRPFFVIWVGQAFSLLGSQLVQFALVWWLTQTTGSATVLATATLAAMLPQIILGPVAGALVDRWNRRLVMMTADSLIAAATLGLAVLFWTGQVQVWHIYLLMFVRSLLGGFHWAAMQASTTLMVPTTQLSRIQGLNQLLNGAVNIGSAPMAALFLAVLPMQGILSIDVLTAMIAVLPLFFVAIPQPGRNGDANAPAGTSVWQDLVAGFRYVGTWPGLMIILVMATLINFLITPAASLQPILVRRHFNGDAIHLAWLEAAWGIGMVAGSLVLSAWGGFRRRIFTSLVGLCWMGAALLAIGLLPASAFWLAVIAMFIVGFNGPMVNGPLLAVVQATTAPEMQGRVFTLIQCAAILMTPFSLMVAGPVGDHLGIQSWFMVGGSVTALLGLVGMFIPALMNIENGRKTENSITPGLPAMPVESAGD